MPLYEFRCAACSKRFTVRRSFEDSGPVKCPGCGGGCNQVYSAPMVTRSGPPAKSTDDGPWWKPTMTDDGSP